MNLEDEKIFMRKSSNSFFSERFSMNLEDEKIFMRKSSNSFSPSGSFV